MFKLAVDFILLLPSGPAKHGRVCPAVPLLDATLDIILERYRDLMRRGACWPAPHQAHRPQEAKAAIARKMAVILYSSLNRVV
jgi:hypothetical protein